MFRKLSAHYKSSFSGLPKEAWILATVMVINRSGTMVLFFLMLYLTQEIHLSISTAGQILSVFGLGAMGGSYVGGWISDRFGTKRIQVVSLLAGGAGYILMGYIKSVSGIIVMVFFVAFVAESFRPASITAMANVCASGVRTRGLALNRLAVNLGISIGPAVGGILANFSYTYIFWAEGLTSIFAAMFLIFFFYESKIDAPEKKSEILTIKRPPLKDAVYLQLLLLVFFIGLVFNQLFNTWPLFLKDIYHFSEVGIGVLMALNAGMIVVFEMAVVHRLEKHPPIPVIALGSLLICAGFGLVGFGGSLFFIVFTVILWTVGEMLSFPFLTSFIANRAHVKRRGAYIGLMTFAFSFAFVIGPLFGSWVYQNYGPSVLWSGIFGIGLILLPGFYSIQRQIRLKG